MVRIVLGGRHGPSFHAAIVIRLSARDDRISNGPCMTNDFFTVLFVVPIECIRQTRTESPSGHRRSAEEEAPKESCVRSTSSQVSRRRRGPTRTHPRFGGTTTTRGPAGPLNHVNWCAMPDGPTHRSAPMVGLLPLAGGDREDFFSHSWTSTGKPTSRSGSTPNTERPAEMPRSTSGWHAEPGTSEPIRGSWKLTERVELSDLLRAQGTTQS